MTRRPSPFRPADVTKDAQIRYRVEPRDIPAIKAARRMHLSLEEFRAKLPELLSRGFPPADPTTGMFFLPAIDEWMEARTGLTTATAQRDDSAVINERLGSVPWGT